MQKDKLQMSLLLDKYGNQITDPYTIELVEELNDNNGFGIFDALFDLSGKIVPARRFLNDYGFSWGIFEPTASVDKTTRFASYCSESNAKDEDSRIKRIAKKGYYIGTIETEAFVNTSIPEISMSNPYDYGNFRVLDNGQKILKDLGVI